MLWGFNYLIPLYWGVFFLVIMMGVVYRVFPDEFQCVLINKTFGCVRKVYNFFLNGRNIQYEALGEYFWIQSVL